MAGSRTIKTLTALLFAMTLGSFLLMLLATESMPPTSIAANIRDPGATGDEVMGLIRQTKYPLRQNWQNVIIHSSNVEPADIVRRVHFVIDANGNIAQTDLWSRQMDGNHVYIYGGDWNSVSIGVLVMTDSSRKRLQVQSDALEKLIEGLRQSCRIDDARVYRHAQLPNSPGGCGIFN
jgi:hypothetical protein